MGKVILWVEKEDRDGFKGMASARGISMKDLFHEIVSEKNVKRNDPGEFAKAALEESKSGEYP